MSRETPRHLYAVCARGQTYDPLKNICSAHSTPYIACLKRDPPFDVKALNRMRISRQIEERSWRLFVQSEVRFAQGVVLTEIVIPEQFTGIKVVVKESEMKKGSRFVEVELWSFEFP